MKKMKRGGGAISYDWLKSLVPSKGGWFVICFICLVGGASALLIWHRNKKSADNKLKNDQLKKKNSSSKP